jgi:hypothetical protein
MDDEKTETLVWEGKEYRVTSEFKKSWEEQTSDLARQKEQLRKNKAFLAFSKRLVHENDLLESFSQYVMHPSENEHPHFCWNMFIRMLAEIPDENLKESLRKAKALIPKDGLPGVESA